MNNIALDLYVLLTAICIPFFIYIGWVDLRTQKIRNRVLLYLLPLAFIHLVLPVPYGAGSDIHLWISAIAQTFLLFSLFIIGYMFKMMGAGDAKYAFCLGFWLAPFGFQDFLFYLCIIFMICVLPLYIWQKVNTTPKFLAWAAQLKLPMKFTAKNDKIFCPFGPFMSLSVIIICIIHLYDLYNHIPF